MKSRSNRTNRRSATIAGNLMLAPMVAAMRLPTMLSEDRSTNPWGTETLRAINEKNAAMAEGMMAAQMSLMQSASSFWFDVFSGRTPSLFSGVAADRAVQAALKPASLRVKANYRRLSSKS
ncbi:hypothetical protein [Mesorhizobium sp. YR577]|uniref:hypothetical protein n=1 Tax=Mesorhizobium sp. YR577 TaxID=1884373 RepID=UPI0008F2C423|nr:hypothetical protein [Mesorhizobium sp. YR577]SFT76843.1 hypothetical protein SAMN05518861_10516 [Mesorhizobium sp. YR577]